MNTGLHGKTALITGASKGIGKAIAIALANEGVRTALCARNEELLKQTELEIKDRFHTEVFSIKANISRHNDIKRTINKTLAKFKRIDILVNNAGSLSLGGIYDFDENIFLEHLYTRLIAVIRFSIEVIPIMKKQGGGKIINIAGLSGVYPDFNFMTTSIINSSIINLTKSLANELAYDNINVNVVNPSYTYTEQTIQALGNIAQKENRSLEEILNNINSQSPFSRLASPEDVASAVVYLASDAANFLTGISFNIDRNVSFK